LSSYSKATHLPVARVQHGGGGVGVEQVGRGGAEEAVGGVEDTRGKVREEVLEQPAHVDAFWGSKGGREREKRQRCVVEGEQMETVSGSSGGEGEMRW